MSIKISTKGTDVKHKGDEGYDLWNEIETVKSIFFREM